MPASSAIEESVRAMLINGSTIANSPVPVPDSRVTHGYRPQDSALPAVTYSVESSEPADVAGTWNIARVTVVGIANTSADALSLAAKIRAAFIDGAFGTLTLAGATVLDVALRPETVGLGDEQEPAQAVVTGTIYWR